MFNIGNLIDQAMNVASIPYPPLGGGEGERGPLHEPTHQAHLASQPSGPTAPIANHLADFVATNGLHSAAQNVGPGASHPGTTEFRITNTRGQIAGGTQVSVLPEVRGHGLHIPHPPLNRPAT